MDTFKVGMEVYKNTWPYGYTTSVIVEQTPAGNFKTKIGAIIFPSGRERGSSGFAHAYWKPLTPEIKSEIIAHKKREYVFRYNYKKVTDAVIANIYDILKEEERKNEIRN